MFDHFLHSRPATVCVWNIVLLLLFQPVAPVFASVQDDCAEKLREARRAYNMLNFPDAIRLCGEIIDVCTEQKKESLELIGLSYMAMEYKKNAEEYIRKLISLVPDYVPPQDSPQIFKDMVNRIKGERQVTAPGEGVTWIVGSSQTVSWNFRDVEGTVTIRLSIDAGKSFPYVLATEVPASVGSKVIVVPNMVSKNCLIRVESNSNSSTYAVGPGLIEIFAQPENGSGPWLWIAGGAIVAGVAGYLILKKNGDEAVVTNLPEPPPRP